MFEELLFEREWEGEEEGEGECVLEQNEIANEIERDSISLYMMFLALFWEVN
jgi:hypothetical protein